MALGCSQQESFQILGLRIQPCRSAAGSQHGGFPTDAATLGFSSGCSGVLSLITLSEASQSQFLSRLQGPLQTSDSAFSRVDLLELWCWIRFKRPHEIRECNYDCMACIIKRLIAWKGCHCQSRNVLGLP